MSENQLRLAVALAIAIWAAFSYLLKQLALQLGDPKASDAWQPFVQFCLLCDLAKVSNWWIVGLLIPYTNPLAFAHIGYQLAKRIGKTPPIFGIVLGIHPLGILVLWQMLRAERAAKTAINPKA